MMNTKKILQLCTFLVLSSTFLTTFSNNATAREKVPQVQSSIIQKTIEQAYTKFKPVLDGENASYIPYLAKADSALYGIAVVTVDGQIFKVGNADHDFPVESVSKIFTLADVLQKREPIPSCIKLASTRLACLSTPFWQLN